MDQEAKNPSQGVSCGQGIQGKHTPSITETRRKSNPQHDTVVILQVMAAPSGIFAEFKEPDGSIIASKVHFLALTKRTYRNQDFYALEPMVADDLAYTLADEFDSFHGLKDVRL